MDERKMHVLMFPYLAGGHISPFLELSKRLAIHGVKVSFVSTPINIARIKPLLKAPNWAAQIHPVELQLPPVEGLPPGAECTADIPIEMALLLQKALDGLEKPFQTLLQQLSPDYVIHDLAHYWIPAIAAKFGIPTVTFLVYSAAASGYLITPDRRDNKEMTAEDLEKPPSGFPSLEICWRPFEARPMMGMFEKREGDIRDIDRLWKCVQGSSALAVKVCFEMENKYLHFLQRATGKPVFSVGSLLPKYLFPGDGIEGAGETYLSAWLHTQQPSSVVFVSFGSESFLTKDQIHELALGLEESHRPFLWALRFPRYADGDPDDRVRVSSSLPEGFESRMRNRGIVVGGWVPQVQILSHPSIGCSLTHSGWSSVTEALMFGVPLIVLPLKRDQGLNARQVTLELQVGVEVERQSDGSFSKDDIRRAVEMVMAGEEGQLMRLKAQEFRHSVTNEETHITDFVERLRQLMPNTSE